MAKDENGNGLVYVGDEGTVSRYHMYVEDRVVLHVIVDRDDPQLRIGFARPNWAETGEPFHYRDGMHTHVALDARQVGPDEADVQVYDRILVTPIQVQVYVFLPFLLADAYVPRTVTV